jgi:bidirectional [NiFe] hydrogenase diaphorase subunit
MSGACLRICTAASCRSRGAETLRQRCSALLESANSASATQGVAGRDVTVKGVGCLGPCSEGPLLAVDDAAGGSRLFSLGTNGQAGSAAVIEAAIEAVAADLHTAVADGDGSALAQWSPRHSREIPADDPFLALQLRRVLAQCGRIDPAEIADALAAGAYRQLQAVLQRNDPAGVIELVRRSGLRGRGGAGYPTGLKWATVAAMPGGEKVVVCNADEGDPGAFMDRTVLEGDPHTLLEGMAIAAHAVGADRGFIYVRAEYPLAIERLRIAIAQAEQQGWLGTAIAGSDFSFHVELRVGAGAYVCGEETALIHSIEGRRGVPRPRPPYPAQRGVFGLPTLINNVETFANIPALLRLGPEAYAPGTKVFSLTGQVRRSGVLEVPMGTPLRTIVETMGGGAPAGRRIKAVQTGGPSGGCVPASALDTPVDYESLQALGTIMGSGGMVVLDDTTNMVDIAAFFMAFSREESCGKCIPCRSGTVQLEMLLRKLLSRQAGELDLAQLERLCPVVSEASLCGLGQSAPRPVLSTLRHFRGDYLALLETTPAPPQQEQNP